MVHKNYRIIHRLQCCHIQDSIAAGTASELFTTFVGGASKSTGKRVTLGLSARMLRYNLQHQTCLAPFQGSCQLQTACIQGPAMSLVSSLPVNERWIWRWFHFSEFFLPIFSADIVTYSYEFLQGQTCIVTQHAAGAS